MSNILPLIRVAALLSLASLAACGDNGLSRPIGLSRDDSPSDQTVFNNAPLSRPPDLEIRPPRPGVQTLTASVATTATSRSTQQTLDDAEQAFVDAAGPSAPTGIRREVDQDAQIDQVNRAFSDRLMAWRPQPTVTPTGRIIQPPQQSGFLDSIF